VYNVLINDAYMQRYKLVAIAIWLNPRLSTTVGMADRTEMQAEKGGMTTGGMDDGRVGGKMGFLSASTQISKGDNKFHNIASGAF
jgi:hypothetical protein